MSNKNNPVKIRLGNTQINAYQLSDSYYAAPGLFRLVYTDIYRYGGHWYWLGSSLPDLKDRKFRGPSGYVALAFQGNQLCHRYVNPTDPESGLCVPVPHDIESAINFCLIGELSSKWSAGKLKKALGRLKGSGQDPIRSGLLKNTFSSSPYEKALALRTETKKTFSTIEQPLSNTPRGRKGFIYLVKLDAYLKLGFTKNLERRLKTFQTTSVDVKLIKAIDGTIQMEKKLHSILGSKARELYIFEDEQRIIVAMEVCEISQLK